MKKNFVVLSNGILATVVLVFWLRHLPAVAFLAVTMASLLIRSNTDNKERFSNPLPPILAGAFIGLIIGLYRDDISIMKESFWSSSAGVLMHWAMALFCAIAGELLFLFYCVFPESVKIWKEDLPYLEQWIAEIPDNAWHAARAFQTWCHIWLLLQFDCWKMKIA